MTSRRSFTLPAPVRLGSTLGAAAILTTGTTRIGRTEAWRACRTPDGPGTVHLAVAGPNVEATAWGPGRDWMLEHSPDLCGASDTPEDFVTDHPLVSRIQRRRPDLRIGRTHLVFEALVPAILGQKVTGLESKRSMRRILQRHGEPAPGPEPLMVLPAPEVLAGLPSWDYHTLGVERKRAETIKRVAERARKLETAAAMSPSDAARLLTAFRGVGAWTAALVTDAVLGDADAVPVGDFHIPNMVTWALAGEPRGTDARMLELLEPFAGHRGRVIRLLKAGGYSAPKYGPRKAVRSHF